jgi:hypothetical protein
VKFVVNVTGKTSDVAECIEKGNCVVACNLNMTLPLSLAMSITSLKMYRALIHTLSFYDIQVVVVGFSSLGSLSWILTCRV